MVIDFVIIVTIISFLCVLRNTPFNRILSPPHEQQISLYNPASCLVSCKINQFLQKIQEFSVENPLPDTSTEHNYDMPVFTITKDITHIII